VNHTSLRSAILGAALCLGACGVEKLDDTGGDAQVPAEVQRILVDSCGVAPGCHMATAPAEMLDLTTGSVAVLTGTSRQTGQPLVDFGNVAGSYLAVKMLDAMPPSGTPMPPTPTLSELDRAILIGWIAGAELPAGDTGMGMTTSEGDAATTAATGDGSTGADAQECSVDVLVVAGAKPIDTGTAAGQIPPDIGPVLETNCGCHLGTELIAPAALFVNGTIDLTTHAGIQMNLASIRSMVTMVEAAGMPPAYYCDLGDGTQITADDQALLEAWLAADAPDGATWVPPA
jgi:hypothetical protein